jgi:uncharacterized protein (DUF58 family)
MTASAAAQAQAAKALAIRHQAEAAASALPPLMVAAERVASTVAQGVHGRRRVGQGDSFWQFRQYQQGDPVQRIDWRQSAKRQRAFIRENEWEAAQSVWLWRDGSASMMYRSRRDLPEKRERAELLTLALMALLVRGGERIALLGLPVRPQTGRGALTRLADALMAGGAAEPKSLPVFELLPRFAHVVLIGDFLQPVEELNALVGRFAGRGIGGYILQVLDPAETALPFKGRARFEGLEGEAERPLIGRVESVRGEYRDRLERQRLGLAAIARAAGWSYARHSTDRPPQTALLTMFQALTRQARR